MQLINTNTQINKLPNSKADNFLVIDGVSKIYPTPQGPYTVIDGVDLKVSEGEFICLIGHSGCGKSTLLNMVSGFNTPTDGVVLLQDQPVTGPGPDRMMVFQNYCLLPWLSVFDNVYLAVDCVFPTKTTAEKRAIVKEHLAMVGLTEAAEKNQNKFLGE
jgi:bicarbonate transport system ATP-binding protein/nitrate/nitrite transport system ATP-binding protein